jgi:arylsulfatase A-like enzyme
MIQRRDPQADHDDLDPGRTHSLPDSDASRSIHAALFAALILFSVDGLTALSRDAIGPVEWLLGAQLVALVGIAVAALFILAAWALGRIPACRPSEWTSGLLAGVAIASPMIDLALVVSRRMGFPFFFALSASVLIVAGSFLARPRSVPHLVWLLCALPAGAIGWGLVEDLKLVYLVDPSVLGAYILAILVVNVGIVVLALGLARIALPRIRVRERTCWAPLSILAGVTAGAMGCTLYTGLYPLTHRLAFVSAFILLTAGIARLVPPPRVPWLGRAVVLSGSLTLVYLFFFVSLVSPALQGLQTRTVLGGLIAEDLAVSSSSHGRLMRLLAQRPEAIAAVRELAASAAWNREAAKLWNASERRPRSVVLLTVDTLRYDFTGYSGRAASGLTPNIDALAGQSARFHQAYVQGGWTLVSIPSLMWSRLPSHLSWGRIVEDADEHFYIEGRAPPGMFVKRVHPFPTAQVGPTLAALLARAGLETAAVVNTGIGRYLDPPFGFARGFHTVANAMDARKAGRDPMEKPRDDLTANLAIDRLHELSGKPFFLWVHFMNLHKPYLSPDSEPFQGYEREVHFVDTQIGRILKCLEDLGESRDAIVVLTSDHGETFGHHGESNHWSALSQEVLRVPLLVSGAGIPVRDVQSPVALMDVAPTILQAFGLPVPDTMEGCSLKPQVAADQSPVRPPIYFETLRLHPRGGPHLVDRAGVLAGKRKVILDRVAQRFQAFDLSTDPGENDDLFTHPDRWESMLDLAAKVVGVCPTSIEIR